MENLVAGRRGRVFGGEARAEAAQTAVDLKTLHANIGELTLEDGRGRWRDNVFVERIWRSIKYEEVYLHAYETVAEARASIRCHLEFYNAARPHSSLKANTPDQVYFNRMPVPLAA